MKTLSAAAVAAMATGAVSVPAVQGAAVLMTIDPTQSFGIWEGWGTSLAWWANCYGQRDDLADAFFTLNDVQYEPNADPDNKTRSHRNAVETIPGLGLTIARYNIGGSTNSTAGGQKMVQSSSMPWWKAIQGFWDNWDSDDPNDASSWTWDGRDVNQISMLKKAQSRGASKFQMFSNSPIWWMCTNHNPSGNDIGALDNLQTWNHDQFAVYLTNTIQHFEEHVNVTFDSVEAFNEPNSDWWNAHGTQEGCHFSPSTQASVLASLQAGLRNRSLTTSIAASDENSYTLALGTWTSFSSSTKAIVDQIDVHGYEQARGPRSELYEASVGKVLWNSEYGEGDASGASLITNLNMDLLLLHPTAWVYWQVVDGSSWGLIEAKDEARGVTGVVQTKYYVLAHYSRHIRPGFKIISVATDAQGADYSTVAAFDNVTSTLVIVSGNTEKNDIERSFDLSKFQSAGLAPLNVSNWQTQINGADRYARQDDIVIPSGTKSFTVTVGAESIRTFELQFSTGIRASLR